MPFALIRSKLDSMDHGKEIIAKIKSAAYGDILHL